MGKIHKCRECTEFISYWYPQKINSNNYTYALKCLDMIEHKFVCGYTNKDKPIDNEQQCKHFIRDTSGTLNIILEKRVQHLKELIHEYEEECKKKE